MNEGRPGLRIRLRGAKDPGQQTNDNSKTSLQRVSQLDLASAAPSRRTAALKTGKNRGALWSRRTPQETATDLAALIEKYRSLWGVKRVVLVGYSFGADVLPATYRALPPAARDAITQISLLGFSTAADWQITVSGWFGSHSNAAADTMTDAQALPMAKLQCVYGVEAHNDACPPLGPLGAELLETKGGHHFGGDYTLVEQAILSGLTRRTHTPFPATRLSAADLSRVHAMTATAEPATPKAHTTFYP